MSNQANNPPAPKRALVVIDVQNEYVTGGLPIVHPPVEEGLERIGTAVGTANENYQGAETAVRNTW